MTLTRHAQATVLGLAFVVFVTPSVATFPPPDQVFACAPSAGAGSLAPGQTLFRYDIDTTTYPEALCNDGTGAVMYVRRASTVDAKRKWHVYLQGGGACRDHQTCADRWCHWGGQNFGTDKMSSMLAPAGGAATDGLFTRQPVNSFADWNHVLIYYCSSDECVGTASAVDLADPDGTGLDYSLHFKGRKIFEAAIATLRALNGPVV